MVSGKDALIHPGAPLLATAASSSLLLLRSLVNPTVKQRAIALPLLRCTNKVLVVRLILTLCSYLVNPKIKRQHDFLLSDFHWCKAETLINKLEKTSP